MDSMFISFSTYQVKQLKRLNLFSNNNNYIGIEILFNIEQLCFINPIKLYKFYTSIKNNYMNDNTCKYLRYFEKVWNPKIK